MHPTPLVLIKDRLNPQGASGHLAKFSPTSSQPLIQAGTVGLVVRRSFVYSSTPVVIPLGLVALRSERLVENRRATVITRHR